MIFCILFTRLLKNVYILQGENRCLSQMENSNVYSGSHGNEVTIITSTGLATE